MAGDRVSRTVASSHASCTCSLLTDLLIISPEIHSGSAACIQRVLGRSLHCGRCSIQIENSMHNSPLAHKDSETAGKLTPQWLTKPSVAPLVVRSWRATGLALSFAPPLASQATVF